MHCGVDTFFLIQSRWLPLEKAVEAGHWDIVEVFLSHYKERLTDVTVSLSASQYELQQVCRHPGKEPPCHDCWMQLDDTCAWYTF